MRQPLTRWQRFKRGCREPFEWVAIGCISIAAVFVSIVLIAIAAWPLWLSAAAIIFAYHKWW
jgi:hypothetical protein